MQSRVAALGTKLLETLHLSVPERHELPRSGIPFSVLVELVAARLAETGWFPLPFDDRAELWTGARLERRGHEIWVHVRHESGVTRLGPVRSHPVSSVEEAVRAFLEAIGGTPVDGVTVDWEA